MSIANKSAHRQTRISSPYIEMDPSIRQTNVWIRFKSNMHICLPLYAILQSNQRITPWNSGAAGLECIVGHTADGGGRENEICFRYQCILWSICLPRDLPTAPLWEHVNVSIYYCNSSWGLITTTDSIQSSPETLYLYVPKDRIGYFDYWLSLCRVGRFGYGIGRSADRFNIPYFFTSAERHGDEDTGYYKRAVGF